MFFNFSSFLLLGFYEENKEFDINKNIFGVKKMTFCTKD